MALRGRETIALMEETLSRIHSYLVSYPAVLFPWARGDMYWKSQQSHQYLVSLSDSTKPEIKTPFV
jgi:hypothetical protein